MKTNNLRAKQFNGDYLGRYSGHGLNNELLPGKPVKVSYSDVSVTQMFNTVGI